ncbi:hypothetical protein GE09DRAFT_1056383 [Coniochaeta sp. 2T2.1]|nr:hypothetical protein GE09DRAFT_1056383 [Coniochaeta sp. 2T2.1]
MSPSKDKTWDLSIFNFEDPDTHSIPHYHEARDHYTTIQPRRFESYQHMKDNYATPEALPTSFGDNAAVRSEDRDPVSHMDIDKSPRPEGSTKVNGYGGQVDVEMLDVSRADDTKSYHDSAKSNVLESDNDTEIGNKEGSRASVSHNGLDVPSATATTKKQPANPPAASRDVSTAKTTATASPKIKRSVENAGHDKDKETLWVSTHQA